MNILYLGTTLFDKNCNSYLRMQAIKKLNHNVNYIDTFKFYRENTNKFSNYFHYRTGYFFFQKKLFNWFKYKIKKINYNPDIIWVDGGDLLGPKILRLLKKYNSKIILTNNDDVTGYRDKLRFFTLKQSLKYFDYCFVYRSVNINEYKKLGVKKVFLTNWCYDEQSHKKIKINKIPKSFLSDVSFIGTNIKGEKRDEFIYYLIKNGLNVSIWGNGWNKSKYWKNLRHYFKGFSLYKKNYAKAIHASKISLGFVSKLNRDSSTTRSVEIPYAGGLLCAERTKDHQKMFKEGKEAFFWSSKEECLKICNKLLLNNKLINKVKIAGRKKVIKNKYGNRDFVKRIFAQIKK